MKNKIFIFLVFLTNIIKGQSVDPETFPILNSGLGTKYLYTNTGGEGKILVEDIMRNSIDTLLVTYSEFYNLITNNQLIGGNTYILIDFQTIYDQPDYDASGNEKTTIVTKTASTTEEIWVLALSSNQIADVAFSKTHPKDRIKYDWTYDKTEVNGTPAKGRITERIDEWNNRTDYDHRTVLFKRYDNGSGIFNQYKDNGNTSQEFLTFGNSYGAGAIVYSNYIGDYYKYVPLLGSNFLLSNNVFDINSYMFLNNISDIFFNNTFGDDCTENLIGGIFNGNIFGQSTKSNNLTGGCNNNNIGVAFRNNDVKLGNISNSTIGDYFERNVIYSFSSSTIGNDAYDNILNINSSSVGNLFQNNGLIIANSNIGNSVKFNSGEIKNFNWGSSVTDFDGISNTKFNNIDGTGWVNYITTTNHPEFYTNYNKEVIKGSNSSYYSKYFNGTNDIYTIID